MVFSEWLHACREENGIAEARRLSLARLSKGMGNFEKASADSGRCRGGRLIRRDDVDPVQSAGSRRHYAPRDERNPQVMERGKAAHFEETAPP